MLMLRRLEIKDFGLKDFSYFSFKFKAYEVCIEPLLFNQFMVALYDEKRTLLKSERVANIEDAVIQANNIYFEKKNEKIS